MEQPHCVDDSSVLALHSDQLAEFGGLHGVRDAGLLASALSRPKNVWAYSSPKPDIVRMAASYAFGLAKNHPFFDGNKRIALVVCHLFLQMNGWRLIAPQQEQVKVILDLAGGVVDEAQFEQWLRARVEPFLGNS